MRVNGRGGVGESAKYDVEITVWKPGTASKPGKCSGTFTADIKVGTETIHASGPFKDAPCSR